jgi:hypothetical protein
MGINPKVCFLGAMGKISLVVFEGRKVGFKKNSMNYSFGGVGWGVWRRRMGIFLLSFFLLWYGDLMNFFSQENIL